MSLSDNIFTDNDYLEVIEKEKVKEFIKELKSPRHTMKGQFTEDGSKLILISYEDLDELAGEELGE